MLLNLILSLAGGVENPALVIVEIAMILAVVVFSLSVHESAHAYAAKRLGDPTAANLGRISLNPLKHLDLFGFLSMALVGIGWAKPVPINPRYFRDPRKGMMLSSLAGPLSNFLLAVVALFLQSLTLFLANVTVSAGQMTESAYYVFVAANILFRTAAYLNFSLAVFNLIPCPPFDGSRIFFYFLPQQWYFKVMRYERYLGLAVLVIVLVLGRIGISPVSVIAGGLCDLLQKPFTLFFDLILRLL